MGTRRIWQFEVAPAGTALTKSNVVADDGTQASVVVNGTSVSTATGSQTGLGAAMGHNGTNGAVARLPLPADTTVLRLSFYFYVPAAFSTAYVSGTRDILTIRGISAEIANARLRLSPNGKVGFNSLGSTVYTAAGTWSPGTLYRAEIAYNTGTSATDGSVTLNVYPGDGTTPVGSVAVTGVNLGAGAVIDLVEWGIPYGGAAGDVIVYDTIQTEDGTGPELGPYIPADMDLAPSVDQPVVSWGAAGQSVAASTIIAGSSGWLREKRVGVPETAAGASQTSTADLDLTGSSRFAYPGTPATPGDASNAGQYVRSALKPGGTSQAAYWLFNVEFVTDSPTVAIRLNAPVAAPSLGRILVNGLPITDTVGNASATVGGGYYLLLTFATSATRTITIIGLNNTQGRFGGVAVAAGYTVTKPTDTPPLLAIIGDSYTNGASPVGPEDTYAWRLANALGYGRSVILAGIGGTGFLATTGGDAASPFINRVAPVMAMDPVEVLVSGGRNDSSSLGDEQAAILAVLDAIGTSVPTYLTNTTANTQTIIRAALSAAGAARGVPYYEMDIDSLPKISDGIHPTQDGHKILADWLDAAMTASTAYPVSGGATATTAAQGAITAKLAVTGRADVVSGANGAVTMKFPVAGTATATSSAQGAITAHLPVLGAASAVSSASGSVTMAFGVSGTAVAVSGASGAVSGEDGLSGTAEVASGSTGRITASLHIGGQSDSYSGAQGALEYEDGLSGTASAVTGVSGAVTANHGVSGTITVLSAASGALIGSWAVSGTAPSVSGASGDVRVTGALVPPWPKEMSLTGESSGLTLVELVNELTVTELTFELTLEAA